MLNKIVIDASAVIALLNQENGYEIVEKNLSNAIISSVNFSEVITVASRNIFEDETVLEEGIKLLKNTFTHIVDFDEDQACIAAILDKSTKEYGLSLGDRACLALAKDKNLPVLTADKVWKKLKVGVEVQLIR
jgi:PIN domain nuclease of toxin-antitoxin system